VRRIDPVDGERGAESRIVRTPPAAFSADETAEAGIDRGSPGILRKMGSMPERKKQHQDYR
jgi:hypothetical protein